VLLTVRQRLCYEPDERADLRRKLLLALVLRLRWIYARLLSEQLHLWIALQHDKQRVLPRNRSVMLKPELV
jgi:hypothetical protein